ncbi:hypothetical protein ACFU6S_44340 [Streptomyces sp. NPDC057456]|uniref:hypothetical protein n=1 Tax=Streptomyces sp. NPDC057456 TaxID=3346139 RepID=UPI0036B06B2E
MARGACLTNRCAAVQTAHESYDAVSPDNRPLARLRTASGTAWEDGVVHHHPPRWQFSHDVHVHAGPVPASDSPDDAPSSSVIRPRQH